MAIGDTHTLRGDWYLNRPRPGCLRAFGLRDGSEVVLEGRLADDPILAAGLTQIGELGRALLEPAERVTVRRLLAPDRFGLLFLELTGRCNERCVHCYASSGPEVGDSLDYDLIESVLRDASALGFRSVQLTGGDPLISQHFLAAASLVRELDLGLEVYTNGLALRRELAERLGSLDAKMAFSFYSHDSAVHDAITQTPGSHGRTLSAVLLALESGLRVRLGVIASEKNAADIEETVAFLVAKGVPESAIASSSERAVGRGTYRSEHRVGERGRAHDGGGARGGKLCVTYQGKVVPCIFDRQTVLGDVRECRLSEIVEREIGSLRFPTHLRPVENELSCQDCQFRRRLLGG